MDYQGNTRKSREKSENAERPEKEVIEKIVVGDVIQKPKGLGRKFKDTFLGGDAKQAARYVSTDVLLPALRNLIVDMVSKGIERVVYGESRYGRRPINYGTRTRYEYGGSPISRPYETRPPLGIAPPPLARVRQNRHDMNDVILATREDADLAVERLHDILDKYDVVSLSDLNVLLGLETSHIDNKWGWTNLTGSEVRQIRQGFLLELPPLEEI